MDHDPVPKTGDQTGPDEPPAGTPPDGVVSTSSIIFLAGSLLLGAACLIWVDWVAGVLLISIGIISLYLTVKRVATARLMARRLQDRNVPRSPD